MLSIRQASTRKRLKKILLSVGVRDLFSMIWAIRAIQTGRVMAGGKVLRFPPEVAKSDMASPYAIHPWRMETILNERLALKSPHAQGKRILNHADFSGAILLFNSLMSAENADDKAGLNGSLDIHMELHRLMQRQAPWQSNMMKYENLYRAGYLYGGELSRAAFSDKVGISLDDFVYSCLYLFSLYLEYASVTNKSNAAIGMVDAASFEIALRHISISSDRAFHEAVAIYEDKVHISYRKSIFRKWPLVSFDGYHHCPLPELILQRVGSGIFYDVISSNGGVRNEVSNKFEKYSRDLISKIVSIENVPDKFQYKFKRNNVDSPDIIIESSGVVSVIVECKATRMAFEAMFGEEPIEAATRGYDEIAKGVLQVWKFVAHCRLGHTDRKVDQGAIGVILTLDPWLAGAQKLQENVIEKAKLLAEKFDYLSEDDFIPVIFCPIEELERLHKHASMDTFLGVISAARQEKYSGWHLSTIHKHEYPGFDIGRNVEFKDVLPTVWPWWNTRK